MRRDLNRSRAYVRARSEAFTLDTSSTSLLPGLANQHRQAQAPPKMRFIKSLPPRSPLRGKPKLPPSLAAPPAAGEIVAAHAAAGRARPAAQKPPHGKRLPHHKGGTGRRGKGHAGDPGGDPLCVPPQGAANRPLPPAPAPPRLPPRITRLSPPRGRSQHPSAPPCGPGPGPGPRWRLDPPAAATAPSAPRRPAPAGQAGSDPRLPPPGAPAAPARGGKGRDGARGS